jgi:hypothetical protein
MNKEELKTIIGTLMVDLRGNWAFEYIERMELLIDLLNQLDTVEPDNINQSFNIYSLISTTRSEIEEPFDGRVFRGKFLYGYQSDEGCTKRVKEYLENVLTYPEYNNIKVSLIHERENKLNSIIKN